jgi:hypothetical protein
VTLAFRVALAFIFATALVPAVAGGVTPIVAGGYRLYPSPARLKGQCERAQRHVRFTVLCPTLMPRTGDGATAATASPLPAGDAGVAPTTFAEWDDYPRDWIAPYLFVGGIYGAGETDPEDWATNNPNYFFHFFVYEGKLSPELLNLSGVETPQHLLGKRTIAGHSGKLYTQVSFTLCEGTTGCNFTGHLTFIWRAHGVTYAASLHRWSANPRNPSVLAVLTALVAHLELAER